MKDGFLLTYPDDETLSLAKERRSVIVRNRENNTIYPIREETQDNWEINLSVKERHTGNSSSDTSSPKTIYPPVLMPPEQEAYLKVSKYDFL